MPDFEAVWQRVRRLEPDLRQQLTQRLEAARQAAGDYASLAAGTRSQAARRLFLTHAAEEAESVRRLQAACFLLTGDSLPAPATPAQPPAHLLTALRQRHTQERADADALLAAAAAAPTEPLRGLLRDLSRVEAAHADALWRFLETRL